MLNNTDVAKELERIAADHGGFLRPEDVVEEAKAQASPLHSMFTWDDTEAAQRYRLSEARRLIRVVVTYTIGSVQCDVPVKAWVSISADRQANVGYRSTTDVMGDSDLRAQLLADAMAEMKRFKEKYQILSELANVFREMDKAAA